jgi:hypothetical protein
VAAGATDCPLCCVFCAGGPTYSLDAVALKRLAEVLLLSTAVLPSTRTVYNGVLAHPTLALFSLLSDAY